MNLDFLIEMGWKSALIAGVALALAAVMRRRAAADRAAVLQLAVALLLATPVIAVTLPALELETPPPATADAPAAMAMFDPMIQAPEVQAPSVIATHAALDDAWSLPNSGQMLLALYGAGLLLVLARLLAGLVTLRRWAGRADPILSSEWTDALARSAAPGRPLPRLLVSDQAPAPMSWGLFRPVILLDRASAARPEDADAIVTHEMAHIARRDWLSLLMARTAVALFWFNPLVWLLERDMFQQVEEAADASALGHVERAAYAQTLVSCAHRHSGARVPANSMAASGLKRRVTAVLEGGFNPAGSRWTVAAMIGCIAFAAPVAAVKLVEAPLAPEAPEVPHLPSAPSAPAVRAVALPPSHAAAIAPAAPLAPATSDTPNVPEVTVDPSAPPAYGIRVHVAPAAPAALAVAAARPAPHAVTPPRVAVGVAPPRPRVPAVAMTRAEVDELREGLKISLSSVGPVAGVDADMIAHVAASGVESAMHAVSHGPLGLEQGALSMERGARQMEVSAHQLRSKAYREQVIQRERAKGRQVTHESLIETSHGLVEGAREMRDGAREMREAARDMRADS